MTTDHSGGQQAAPTPREAMQRVRNAALLISNLSATPEDIGFIVARLTDVLDPVLATVERLEAAEKAKAGRGAVGPIPGSLAQETVEACDPPNASAPVPPSPPAARERVERWAVVGQRDDIIADDEKDARETASDWNDRHEYDYPHSAVHLTELRDGEEIIAAADLTQLRRELAEAKADKAEADKSTGSWMRAADFERAAADRLRARLADGVRGKVEEAPIQWVTDHTKATPVRMIAAGSLPTGTLVLVLPDEPEGLTTDAQNPEPGREEK